MRTSKVAWTIAPLTVALIVTAGSQLGSGQQTVPFQGGVPVAPLGLSGKPLPALPVVLDTAEGMRVRVSAVARGLENPWSIAFLPDGTMLVTERMGRLRAIRNGVLDPQPVAGTPKGIGAGVSGLPGAVHAFDERGGGHALDAPHLDRRDPRPLPTFGLQPFHPKLIALLEVLVGDRRAVDGHGREARAFEQ